MKVYYVRHGESEANVAGIASGGEHITQLTENGREQARKVGKDLKDKSIDLIVCSPLGRTVETAQIIAKELGINPNSILQNEAFIEREFGKYSGRPHSEYRAAVLAGNEEGMESAEHMKKRVADGFEWLKKLDANNVVLVSHGSTGRMIRIVDKDMHHGDMYKFEGFKNTEIYEFEL